MYSLYSWQQIKGQISKIINQVEHPNLKVFLEEQIR